MIQVHDIKFILDENAVCPDIQLEDGDWIGEKGLENAVLISLFTNQYVPPDELPEGYFSSMGWWGDTIATPENDEIGSILWTLERSVVSEASAKRIEQAAVDSLNWMIEDGLVTDILSDSEVAAPNTIQFTLTLVRPDGDDIPFEFMWDGQATRVNDATN